MVVLGTRPEIVKLSPVIAQLERAGSSLLVHSGQHYSYEMDRVFFEDLRLPEPAHKLAIGSGSHGWQVGGLLTALDNLISRERPDAVLVQGDTNTTLSGALAAAKLHVPVVHLEAGCRSGNRHMPEEINRVLVGRCADLHLAPNQEAADNLLREGTDEAAIEVIGSTGVDACQRNAAPAADRRPALLRKLGIAGDYALATVHRAENTEPEILAGIMDALAELSRQLPIVVPLHPRTRAAGAGPRDDAPGLLIVEPLGYLDNLALIGGARVVLTDSGGIQEEAPALGVAAVVMRQETEWGDLLGPSGNVLAGNRRDGILAGARSVLARPRVPVVLDALQQRAGAADRAVAAIERRLSLQPG
jgi:UDP-N-acetylglucosamine 2-epimerase (non-hydrolysing)